MISMQSNVSISSRPYRYATLNSCRYLKSETHLQNAQVNKASFITISLSRHEQICLRGVYFYVKPLLLITDVPEAVWL